MLRLTALLFVGMFLTLMIAGEDRGQLRPGLARAALEPKAVPVAKAPAEKVVPVAALPVAEPASASAAAPKPLALVAAADPAPEPQRAVVGELPEVFTLSNLPTEDLPATPEPAVNGGDVATDGTDGQIMYVTANSVNVREAPSTDASVLGKLGSGEAALVVADVDGEWARIIIQGDGMEGYVATRFLSAESP